MLFLALFVDLVAPFLALLAFASLLRKWPAWSAWAVALGIYLTWANLMARAVGYCLSIYVLVGVSMGVGTLVGRPGVQDRAILFFLYPALALLLLPTLLLWGGSLVGQARDRW